ncbi:MAG: FAD binding domain-containing protein [Candidatus Eisenbacteria bacterium]|nr:FAD binding domain-containing protein [Candidatus Eisenbacteria bacterium]
MIEHFFIPETLAEALRLKNEHKNSRFLAGGTEIFTRKTADKMNCISLQKINSLKSISLNDRRLSLGAMITLQELIEAAELPKPLEQPLKSAAQQVRNRNIRNIATVGGNIVANKSCSDLIPLFLVMQASLQYQEATLHTQTLSLAEYIARPKESKAGLIGGILLPIPVDNEKFFLKRFSRTRSDLGIINIAVSVTLNPGRIIHCRMAIGGIDEHVVQPQAVSRFFQTLSPKLELPVFKNDLRKLLETEIRPITDVRGSTEWKREVVFGLLCEIADQICSDWRK